MAKHLHLHLLRAKAVHRRSEVSLRNAAAAMIDTMRPLFLRNRITYPCELARYKTPHVVWLPSSMYVMMKLLYCWMFIFNFCPLRLP